MINEVKNYRDEKDNIISYSGSALHKVSVIFTGSNNKLHIDSATKITDAVFRFDCDNGICNVGNNSFSGYVRIGHGCKVEIGNGVTCTGKCYISTAEESGVVVGKDCMIATSVEIRSDDAHPIFDVMTEKRVNFSKDIIIGDHVWIGAKVTLLSGSEIGNGSVIGLGSIVKSKFPNNVVAVGSPAQIVKRILLGSAHI
ncbi:acyltransferase [Yersinia intermedia]|nr:acyltransferase [Yersinia intermedia]